METEPPSITSSVLNLSLPPNSSSASSQAQQLRSTASAVLSNTTPSNLSTSLLHLLTQVIKPLFSSQSHASLSSTGRPSHYAQSTAQSTLSRFSKLDINEDKPWKLPWTYPLLTSIIKSYLLIKPDKTNNNNDDDDDDHAASRKVLDSQFFLLSPALLNIADDYESTSKIAGAKLVRLLCETVDAVGSDVVVRSGMAEVFCEALRSKFSELPSLAKEEVSEKILGEVYGAWFVIAKLYGRGLRERQKEREGKGELSAKERGEKEKLNKEKNERKRQQCLKVLMRHGLLYGLGHLDAGRNTSYVRLTALLMRRVTLAVEMMGVDAVVFLKDVLPLCRAVLMDPFVLNARDLMLQTMDTMKMVMKVCAERVRERWWPEILRAVVGAWLNVIDEEASVKKMGEVTERLRGLTQDLSAVVDVQEWRDARMKLIEEEPDLKHLFDGT